MGLRESLMGTIKRHSIALPLCDVCVCITQVKRVVIIGTSVLFFGTSLSMKTKIGAPTFMLLHA